MLGVENVAGDKSAIPRTQKMNQNKKLIASHFCTSQGASSALVLLPDEEGSRGVFSSTFWYADFPSFFAANSSFGCNFFLSISTATCGDSSSFFPTAPIHMFRVYGLGFVCQLATNDQGGEGVVVCL